MTSAYTRSGGVAGRRPNSRPGSRGRPNGPGRKPQPLPLLWRLAALALTVLLIAGLGAVALRFVGGSVLAAFGEKAAWRGGYTGQYLVKNGTKNTMASWKVEFDLPKGSQVLRHWGATMTADDGHYVFERAGADLKRGEAERLQFIVTGAGKPENCRLNGNPCDDGDDAGAPTAPGGLRVTGATVSSIRLAWQPSTDDVGVSAYRVYMDGKLAASTSATTTTITRLRPGRQHEFAVAAVDLKGNESARSAAVRGATPSAGDSKRPGKPTGLAAGDVTTSTATITWDAATDNVRVVGYNVYKGDDVVATSARPAATIAGLSAGTSHRFRVTAVDAAENESAKSAPITVRTANLTVEGAAAAQPAEQPALRRLQTQQVDQLPLLTEQVAQQAQITQQLQQQAQQAEQQVLLAEQQAAQIDQQLEQQIQLAQFQVDQARQQAAQVQQQANQVRQQAGQISDQAQDAQQKAQDATDRARTASEDAGQDINAQARAQQQVQEALQLQQFAQQLGQQAVQAQAQVQQAEQQVAQAGFAVEQALQQVDQAKQQADQARQQANQQIEFARQQASQAKQQADQAQKALDEALAALSKAQGGTPATGGGGTSGGGTGDGADSGSGQSGPENPALGSPELKVVDLTDSSVTLRWTTPGSGLGIAGFDILRDGQVVQEAGPGATTTVVTGLDAESRFAFSVVARGMDGTRSKPSNVVEAVTVAAGLDNSATPANLHASCVTDHSVSLDWDPPADAANVVAYDVYAQGQKVASVRNTSATIDGLDPQQSVQFVVKSRDANGLNSPASSVATVTTLRAGEQPQKSGEVRRQTRELPVPDGTQTQPPVVEPPPVVEQPPSYDGGANYDSGTGYGYGYTASLARRQEDQPPQA